MAIRQYDLYEKTPRGEEKIFTFRINKDSFDNSDKSLHAIKNASLDLVKGYKANNYYLRDIKDNKKIYLRNCKK